MGLGAPSPRGSQDDIRPVQTWEAEPHLANEIFPKPTYFVSTGSYESGVLVDRNAIGQAIKIEFEGADRPEVNLYQNGSGDYVDTDSGHVLTTSPYTNRDGVTMSVENA